MHLRSIHTQRWVRVVTEDLTPEQSRHARRIGAFIYKKMKPAMDAFGEWRFSGDGRRADPHGKFLKILQQTWKPNDGNRFAIPAEITQGSLPIMVMITDTGGGTYFSYYAREQEPTKPGFGVIKIDVAKIEQAKSWQELGSAVREHIMGVIMHEPVHIHNAPHTPGRSRYHVMSRGTSKELRGNASGAKDARQAAVAAAAKGDVTTAQKKQQEAYHKHLEYLASAPEIEAYGRQFAIMYHRSFPRSRYDPELMKKLLARGAGGGNAQAYFEVMRKPSWQNWRDPQGAYPFKRAAHYMDSVITKAVDELLEP